MTSTARTRKKWMPEEDALLRCEADAQLSQGCLRDWNRIAAKLPGRTNKDCRKRWGKVCENVNKGVWSSKEDEQLRAAVEKFGPRWTHVAQSVGTRHADQCAKRWTHSLDPDLDRRQWVADDDVRLLGATAKYGRNWSVIVEKVFPARSLTDIKNRHAILERKQKQALGPSNLSATPLSPSLSSSENPNSTLSEVAQTPMSIDSDSWLKQDFSVYGFDSLDDTDLLGMGSGSDHFSTTMPLSLEKAPSPDFSTPSCLQLSDIDDGDPLPDEIHNPFPSSRTPTLLSNNPGSDLDLQLNAENFSVAYNGAESTPNAIDRPARSTSALDPTDLPTVAGSGGATTQSGQLNTLILEDLQPETVSQIMTSLFTSNTKVKMRLYSQE